MTQKELTDALIKAGHSPNKALELAIDVFRGDNITRAWVRTLLGGVFRERINFDDDKQKANQ